jgi:hypothetical protein
MSVGGMESNATPGPSWRKHCENLQNMPAVAGNLVLYWQSGFNLSCKLLDFSLIWNSVRNLWRNSKGHVFWEDSISEILSYDMAWTRFYLSVFLQRSIHKTGAMFSCHID